MSISRIEALKKQLFESPREVSLERALLYTQSHKQTENEPIIIRRAKATAHILDHVNISIREGELIAGNRTIKPRSGIISPEMSPYWIYKEIDSIATRPQDNFIFRDEDKKTFSELLYPYWKGRSLKDYISDKLTYEVKASTSLKIVTLNQTDKGQGHIIPDFENILKKGLGTIVEEIKGCLEKEQSNHFYQAAIIVHEATQRHISRYATLARLEASNAIDEERKAELLTLAEISEKITTKSPDTFYEACQLVWYVCIALQYESNASSISLGQFDKYMYPYFKNDLLRNVPLDELKEILKCLWIKTNDVVLIRSENSAKYFAGFPTGYTITLGGLTVNGRCAVNDLSYLALETYQDIRLPQPNLGVRLNELIPRDFLLKTAETIRLGTGIPQIFNDEVVVPAFLNRGVSLEDARDYSVVGCVELTIPGKTYGLHDIALFNLLKVMEVSLKELEDVPNIDFDQIIEFMKKKIEYHVQLMVKGSNLVDVGQREYAPVPLLSSIIDNCLEKGLDITEGGAKYNFSGVQGIGIANLSDSLHALKKIVFEEKRLTFKELIVALDSNFEGEENRLLQARLINKYDKYGNDIDEVDYISSDLLRHYSKVVEKYSTPRGGHFTPGSYTVSAHIPLGEAVGATPDGRNAAEQLADGGLSPMVGRDSHGPTAALKSVSKLDGYLLSNGSLLNVKFSPSTLAKDDGLHKLADFLLAFMKLKILHVQFNVVNAKTLKEAQENPIKYSGLVVRVAGYSAFFSDLSIQIQNDIIERTEHEL
ncbi:MAG: formate C-acetyltransferase [Firmicutes bacterium HGW-Firmicutes-1]|nr:MAG: formate C-acetyltransferase [Firmicutes bacterium HGW-Firmicutes-1]